MVVEGVVRVEVRQAVRLQVRGEEGAGGLVLDVRAQVPRHRLEPGDGVRGSPGLGLIAAVLQTQDRVLKGQAAARALLQVRVHPGGVGLVVTAGILRQSVDLLLSRAVPAQRAEEGVGGDLGLAEELGQAPGGHVPAEVHLPEAVLRVDVSLGAEQVVRAGGGEGGDTVGVALDGDVCGETVDGDGAVRLREGAVDGPDEDGRDHDGECDGGGERPQEHAPQDEEETARARPTGVRRVL